MGKTPDKSKDQLSGVEVDVYWYVVFEDRDMFSKLSDNSFWRIFTKEGYRHCWVFTLLDGKSWLSINPTRGGVVVGTWDNKTICEKGYKDFAEFCIANGATEVLPCYGKLTTDFIPRLLPISCVSVVKHILGVKAKIATPVQLYKHLVSKHLDVVKYKEVLQWKEKYNERPVQQTKGPGQLGPDQAVKRSGGESEGRGTKIKGRTKTRPRRDYRWQ